MASDHLNRNRAAALLATILALVFGVLCAQGTWVGTAYSETVVKVPVVPVVPPTIAGKPYSITPGGSPGTWLVKWGDQSLTWKAQPWMEDRQQKLGPAYISQWTTPGLPSPFEIPIEKRDQISANELPDRCLTYSYFGPYYTNAWDASPTVVRLPNGSIRTSSMLLELYSNFTSGNGKEFLTAAEASAGNVMRKYLWEL